MGPSVGDTLDITCELPSKDVLDSTYSVYIGKRYLSQDIASSSMSSFPSPTDKFFTLAMIKREKYRRVKRNDEIIAMSITGKIDDIFEEKHFIKIEDILPKTARKRVVVLIEGAPGSGKSTLCLHIGQQWARHMLFCEYDIIILVRLRDPEIQKASSVADLLPCRDDKMAKNIADKIAARDGKNTLWILDGWDELPSNLQKSSLFWDMINAPKTRKTPIALSDIIVTSRPISSSELQKIASARFEILGFTIKQQEGYFRECFQGNSAESEYNTFLEIVCNSPVLQSLCSLPQYAVYVINLYLCEGDASLSSEYEIFSAVIVNCVYRYYEKQDKISLIEHVECLDHLFTNEATKESFSALCQLAYCSIIKNKVSFSPRELPQNFTHLGLLQGVESLAARGKKLSYYFPNLSIQETLAAYHIAKLPDDEQSAEFEKLFHQPRFSAVFKFYAAITQLKSPGIDKVLINVIQEMNIPKVISLLHCLHEAQNDALCRHLAQELSGVLYLFGSPLNPLDSYAVGYLLSNICTSVRVHSGLTSITGEFRVDLDNCQLGNQGCKSLVKGVRKYLSCGHAITSRAIFELAGNMITDEGILYIAELLSETNILSKLTLGHMLSGNQIESSGLQLIAKALITNNSLSELDLSNCSFQITSENGPVVENMLKSNKSLTSLLFRNTRIGDPGVSFIARGLMHNTAITTLRLYNCGVTSSGARCIGDALKVNTSLKLLNISHNQLGRDGARGIAGGLHHNYSLVTCVFDSCEIDDGGVVSLANALEVGTAIGSLWLEDNPDITSRGLSALKEALLKNRSMEKVILPHQFTKVISENERELNKTRKLSGLPAIELRGMYSQCCTCTVESYPYSLHSISNVCSMYASATKHELKHQLLQDAQMSSCGISSTTS